MHAPLEISGRRWTLAAMTAALTLVFLDQTAVSVALPSIQRDFGASHTELAWVMNAFMLTLAALAAAGGRLGDIAGRRRVLIAGLAVFAAASVGCAVAQSEGWLIAARAVQGLGAAAIMPIATAIVSDEFPDAQRGRALGIYIGVASFFLSVGPLVGGALSEFGSWRWIFLVNLPVVAATAVITVRTGAGGGVQAAGRLAPVSVATLAGGLGAVVLALMEAQTWGWDSAATAVLLAAGLVALAAFPFVQARRGEPLIRLELLRDRLYLGSALVALCSRFVVVGALVLSAIYLQEVLDLNPFQAGLALLPATIPILLAAPIAGAIVDRRGPRGPACAGMLLIAAALLSLALLAPEARYALLWPGLAAFGAGVGIVTAATSAAGMAAAFGRRRGEAAGLLTTARQLGGTIGLAAMTSAFVATEFGRLDEFLRDAAATPHERARIDLLLSGDAGRGLATAERIPADVLNAARDALAAGLEAALLVAAGVALLAAVAGLVLIRGPGRPRGS